MLEAESSSPAARSRKSQGPNRSMSGSNQHLMRINPRRMERSTFVEVPCARRSKGGDRAARKAPRRKRQCRPRSRFLMEAAGHSHRGHGCSTNRSLLDFLARHL
jgi:hypothetical protein